MERKSVHAKKRTAAEERMRLCVRVLFLFSNAYSSPIQFQYVAVIVVAAHSIYIHSVFIFGRNESCLFATASERWCIIYIVYTKTLEKDFFKQVLFQNSFLFYEFLSLVPSFLCCGRWFVCVCSTRTIHVSYI